MKRCLSCFLLCALAIPANASDTESWQWAVTPYVWLPQTSVDLSLQDTGLGGGTVGFKDLLDQLDVGFMIGVEGVRNHWGFFSDLTYVEISDSEQRPVFLVRTETEATMLDFGLSYWPGGAGSDLALLAGVRYNGFDNRFTFRLGDTVVADVRDDDAYYDALVGLRYRYDFAGPWELLTRVDASFGDSEGTWMARATFGRTVGQSGRNRLLLGYQYQRADFQMGDLETSFTYHGPTAGFSFRF